ncbi:MAG: [FeFe] hydrogenase, group A, partial [Myxococcota bacterium]
MRKEGKLTLNGRSYAIKDTDTSLLELARRVGVEIPTFCYHSELSVYGACRLCLVDVEGMGIVTSCTTKPADGMVVRTQTGEIRQMRRIAVELLLASHDSSCPTCPRSADCKLQSISRSLGVEEVRFRNLRKDQPIDTSSPAIVRNPNRCVLCGDCVRFCSEIQGIGALDFVNRGREVAVMPAFGKTIADVECVGCGQCAAVCPTAAIVPRSDVERAHALLEDPDKVVVVQIAPAVRVALGEHFGMEPGSIVTGQIVSALRALGFDRVYDTAWAADLTVMEETHEFFARRERAEEQQAQDPAARPSGPLFTSCCPAWVRFAEQYYPSLLPNLSTCRSPQQMFGSVAREILPELLGVEPEKLAVVSIMPCTAKKMEAGLPVFERDGRPDVDVVLTTQELARMIEGANLRFRDLEPSSLDLPFGYKTGAGVIFGASGGVTEAVLRLASEKLGAERRDAPRFPAVRGSKGLLEAELTVEDKTVKAAVVHGLKNAREVAEAVMNGDADYDLVEVMACPGGCVAGAGQPATDDRCRGARTRALHDADSMLQLHKAQDNNMVRQTLDRLGGCGSEGTHRLL